MLPAGLLAATARPSIVLVLTDDQDAELGGLTPISATRRLIGGAGATAAHYLVNTPVCCPSRSQMLTGRYAHNLRDASFEPFPPGEVMCGDEPVESPLVGSCGCMRMNCSKVLDAPTYATTLQAAGYTTAYFGKYLNPPAMVRFCRNETLGPLEHGWPAGWDTFYGMCDQASTPKGGYYDMNWVDSEAGAVTYTGDAPDEYTTSIVGNRTARFIKAHAARPFLVVAAVRAPHAPQIPAPWYEHAQFPGGAAVPRSGAYNHSADGKPAWLALNKPLTKAEATEYDARYLGRWRSLLAVDDLVSGVIDALKEAKLLETTYVVFTSDNGFHFGHFRLPPAKMHVYEFDVHVPFFVRGPGVCANSTIHEVIGNTDLAPTFLEIAGVPADALRPDGKSVLPLLQRCAGGDAVSWRDEFPIEYFALQDWPELPPAHRMNDNPNNTYRALRIENATHSMLYAQHTVVSDWDFASPYFEQSYDLRADPHQLRNAWPATAPAEQARLRARLDAVWRCQGKACP